jgi:hypothetical protein
MAVWVLEYDGGTKDGRQAWWVFIKHEGKTKKKKIGTGAEGRKAAIRLAENLSARIALKEFSTTDEPCLTFKRVRARAVKFQQQGFQNNTIRYWINVLQSCFTAAIQDNRISEVMGLQVGDLDFDRREIHLRRTWGNQSRGPDCYGPLKSGKICLVVMSQRFKMTLHEYITMTEPETWLFPAAYGRPMTPNSYYSVHWRPLFASGVAPYRHPHVFSPHPCLRHAEPWASRRCMSSSWAMPGSKSPWIRTGSGAGRGTRTPSMRSMKGNRWNPVRFRPGSLTRHTTFD